MWQVAVLTRFEALQSFLSSGERESVKSALFEQRGAASVNAETNELATEETAASSSSLETQVAAGGSAHLERSVVETSLTVWLKVSLLTAAAVQVEEVEARGRQDPRTHVHRRL